MFNRLAMDPGCYVDLDLTMQGPLRKVGNRTVSKFVNRAGQCLRLVSLCFLPTAGMSLASYYKSGN